MNKEEKNIIINDLSGMLEQYPTVYITDTSSLTVAKTSQLRRLCFNKGVKMVVAKNKLIRKAMERANKDAYEPIFGSLKGTSAILFSEASNAPAKLIKEFRKSGNKKPLLKGAFVDMSVFIGDDQLDTLASLKSKNELVGDIIGLLQSPARNVISALQSSGGKLAGIIKTLSERPE
ncbi:MAG: 50S ribosomal protein L10 [Bacteroidota bacterium]